MAKKEFPTDPADMARVAAELAAGGITSAFGHLATAEAALGISQRPSAYAMAALALEEIGKAGACMTMVVMPPEVRTEFRADFQRLFTDHEAKAALAHLMLAMITEGGPSTMETLFSVVAAAAKTTIPAILAAPGVG